MTERYGRNERRDEQDDRRYESQGRERGWNRQNEFRASETRRGGREESRTSRRDQDSPHEDRFGESRRDWESRGQGSMRGQSEFGSSRAASGGQGYDYGRQGFGGPEYGNRSYGQGGGYGQGGSSYGQNYGQSGYQGGGYGQSYGQSGSYGQSRDYGQSSYGRQGQSEHDQSYQGHGQQSFGNPAYRGQDYSGSSFGNQGYQGEFGQGHGSSLQDRGYGGQNRSWQQNESWRGSERSNDEWNRGLGGHSNDESSRWGESSRSRGETGGWPGRDREQLREFGSGRTSTNARWGESSFFGKGPKDYKRSDDRIREDVCDCLSDDDYVDASDITVTVRDGEVTLEGNVSDRRAKHRAEDIADGIRGVKDVHNRLSVQKGLIQEMGDRIMGREETGHAGSGTKTTTSTSGVVGSTATSSSTGGSANHVRSS